MIGSEDGNIFLWDIEKTGSNHYKEAKQKAYEFFNPFLVSKLDQEQHLKSLTNQTLKEPEIAENNESDDEIDMKDQTTNRHSVCNIALFAPK